MTKIICVLGVTCTGKSRYCEDLRDSYRGESDDDRPLPLLLQMGRFFRNTIGPDFFVELDSPAAPHATECWVRNMVYNAQTFAFNYGRDLIIDGFPRTSEQFDWLMLSSLAADKQFPVEIVHLTVAEGVFQSRMGARAAKEPKQAALLEVRAKKDVALLTRVHNSIKEAISNHSHPHLTLKEING